MWEKAIEAVCERKTEGWETERKKRWHLDNMGPDEWSKAAVYTHHWQMHKCVNQYWSTNQVLNISSKFYIYILH